MILLIIGACIALGSLAYMAIRVKQDERKKRIELNNKRKEQQNEGSEQPYVFKYL